MGEGRYSLAALTDAFYDLTRERAVRASTRSPGDLARPTELTRGPWDANAQHAGPPSALLARAIERCEPRERARIGRITVEILVPIPIQPLTVSARVARPGRSVEMLEASLEGPDGEVMRARGWRLAEADITADWEQDEPPPGREHAEALEFFPDNEGSRAPRARRSGVSAPLDWSDHIFINTDLTVHLLRPPEGEWVCLDSVTHVDGLGMTDTAVWDERGRIGRAAQTLLVRVRA